MFPITRSLHFLVLASLVASAEPIVVNGGMVAGLVGQPVSSIRILGRAGMVIPFQVDEVTAAGEYVCPDGERPNADSGNGVLDARDEIVFLWEDADSLRGGSPGGGAEGSAAVRLELCHGEQKRTVTICADSSLPLSAERYIRYDAARQYISTPYFYAQFGRNRFHFTRAGIMDFTRGSFVDLTNELRIVLHLRALGLIPINYTEESIICLVRRYKVGPVRLIRRGDFHLKLGLGLKGSRAAVNQICYPQMVNVPVTIHLPVRFRSLFSEAHFEMTPVVRKEARGYSFRAPVQGFSWPADGAPVERMLHVVPNNSFMSFDNGSRGYGWVLQAHMPDSLLDGSAYVLRRPSERPGMAECGYRLVVRELPKGHYLIANWVLFSRDSASELSQTHSLIVNPAVIRAGGRSSTNRLSACGMRLAR